MRGPDGRSGAFACVFGCFSDSMGKTETMMTSMNGRYSGGETTRTTPCVRVVHTVTTYMTTYMNMDMDMDMEYTQCHLKDNQHKKRD